MSSIALPWILWPTSASAENPWYTSDPKHLFYQHYDSTGQGTYDEDFCVDDITGTVGDSNLYNMVSDTLLSASPRWDRMNGADSRVDLYGVNPNTTGSCGSLSSLSWVELRVYVNATAPSWCGSASCTDFAGPIPAVNPKHNQYGIMYMQTAHVPTNNTSEYRRNINHEAGHVWGLRDPITFNDYYGGCYSSWGVGYYSVMHQYSAYCSSPGPYVVYPQGGDFENVITFMLPAH